MAIIKRRYIISNVLVIHAEHFKLSAHVKFRFERAIQNYIHIYSRPN